MKDNIIKKNSRERALDQAITALKINYGSDIMNSTMILGISNSADAFNITKAQFYNISAKDSTAKYIARIYLTNHEVMEVTVLKTDDVIEYVNKYNAYVDDYIRIDLTAFSKLGYDVNKVDPNLVDTNIKVKLADANRTEDYNANNESSYINGFTKVKGQLISVKINAKTNNIVTF